MIRDTIVPFLIWLFAGLLLVSMGTGLIYYDDNCKDGEMQNKISQVIDRIIKLLETHPERWSVKPKARHEKSFPIYYNGGYNHPACIWFIRKNYGWLVNNYFTKPYCVGITISDVSRQDRNRLHKAVLTHLGHLIPDLEPEDKFADTIQQLDAEL